MSFACSVLPILHEHAVVVALAVGLRAAAGGAEDEHLRASLEGELADGAAGGDADPYRLSPIFTISPECTNAFASFE